MLHVLWPAKVCRELREGSCSHVCVLMVFPCVICCMYCGLLKFVGNCGREAVAMGVY